MLDQHVNVKGFPTRMRVLEGSDWNSTLVIKSLSRTIMMKLQHQQQLRHSAVLHRIRQRESCTRGTGDGGGFRGR